MISVLFALLTALFNGTGVGPAATGRRDRASVARPAPVLVRLPDQAQGLAGRDRAGHPGRGLPGHRAGHRPGGAGPAHLHHRAAVHPARGQPGEPPPAAPDDVVRGRLGHGQPGGRARRRRPVGWVGLRQHQGVDYRADRHRRLRGGGDHRGRPGPRQRAGGGAGPRGRLRLRADRHAAEERGGGPAARCRGVLQHLAAVRDRRGRGRRAVPAAERPAGRVAGLRPAAAHPGRRADQRLRTG